MNAYRWPALLACILTSAPGHAQQIGVREQVSVDVPAGLFGSGSPTPELKQQARKLAIDKAWRRYQAQNFSQARAQQAIAHEAALRGKVETELCSFSFYDERFEKETRKFSLEVRGSCDQRRVDAVFQQLSAASGATDAGGGVPAAAPRQRMPSVSFVFLARRAASATDQRENASTVSTNGSESVADQQQSSRGTSSSVGSEQVSVTQRARTSTTQFDTQYQYEVEATDDAMTAVASVLQTNRFRVSRYPDLVTTCSGPGLGELSRRYAEMRVSTAWSPAETKGMFDAVRQCEVPLFAFGLMEVLKAQQSGIGATTVTVSLNVRVNDLSSKVPSECASISSQFQAVGRDRLEATKAALKHAADQGTRELVDIMRQNCLN